MEGLLALS